MEVDKASNSSTACQVVSTKEFAALTGATVRQLQYWDDQGILSPEKRGHRRCYLPEMADTAKRLVTISRSGFKLSRTARLASVKPGWGKCILLKTGDMAIIGGVLLIAVSK